ncbi:NACHT, LRR and PYD domains-containing protein 14 [Podila humilis]|nr:NACHT, LRR and PYD domains-containing protein 14 [Podila humilis]
MQITVHYSTNLSDKVVVPSLRPSPSTTSTTTKTTETRETVTLLLDTQLSSSNSISDDYTSNDASPIMQSPTTTTPEDAGNIPEERKSTNNFTNNFNNNSNTSTSTSNSGSRTTSSNSNNININSNSQDDDVRIHTHLQLRGYLQDLEEAEVLAQEETEVALAAEASLYSSMHHHHHHHHHDNNSNNNSSNNNNDSTIIHPPHPAQWPELETSITVPILPGDNHTAALGVTANAPLTMTTASLAPLPGLLSQLLTPVSIETEALQLESLQQALDLEDGLVVGGGGEAGGAGGGIGGGSIGDNLGHGDYYDDEDEECLRPSETKYLLYDDHNSPVTVDEALMILNEILEDRVTLAEQMKECIIDNVLPSSEAIHDNQKNNIMGSPTFVQSSSSSSLSLSSSSMSLSPLPTVRESRQGNSILDRLDTDSRQEFDAMYRTSRLLQGEGDAFNLTRSAIVDMTDDRARSSSSSTTPPEMISPVSLSNCLTVLLPEEEEEEEKSYYKDGGVQERSGQPEGPDISLNLAGNTISPITIHDFFFSRHYPRLVYLNLWDTNLGIWGAQAVGGLLADRSCRIEYLNLGKNRLGFEGIVQLSGAYKNQSVVELDLSENHLGPKAVHSLQQIMVRLKKDKGCNIRRLNLSNNEINDVGCISIAKIIQGTLLAHLDLSFNKISDWGASTILASFESNELLALKDINMEANPLSFAGGVDICKILALPESRITNLDLRGAKVTDVGVPYLAEALKSHQCVLMSLNLFDCQLTDTGILKIAIKLSVNKSLRVLGLGCNCIGDLGILSLGQALTLNSSLEELDLSENDLALTRAGLSALMSAMTTNTTLVDLRLDVDGHPHVQAASENEFGFMAGMQVGGQGGGGSGGGTGYGFGDLALQLQHPQQEQLTHPQHGYHGSLQMEIQMQTTTTDDTIPFLSVPSPVAEILAPTHHATILAPPFSETLEGSLVAETVAQHQVPTLTSVQSHPQPQQQQHQPGNNPYNQHGLHLGHPGDERDLERERQQLLQALSTLKTYVRRNYKRTERMRRLCFEMLVVARVLMFAKDAEPSQALLPTKEQREIQEALGVGGCGHHSRQGSVQDVVSSLAIPSTERGQREREKECGVMIPLSTGLPTPPLRESGLEGEDEEEGRYALCQVMSVDSSSSSSSSTPNGYQVATPATTSSTCAKSTITTNDDKDDGTTLSAVADFEGEREQQQQQQQQQLLQYSMAGMPWEIKVLVLRWLDVEGLLSERQFQGVIKYASQPRWETTRRAWDRWGEIREGILEQTGCYYYES